MIDASAPIKTLTGVFLAWKALLLAIALGTSISPAYDTSTSLLFQLLYPSAPSKPFTARLSSWDAIYFVHTAKEGYVYEQEWAFGTGVALAMRYAAQLTGLSEPLAGILLSNISHLLTALVLYKLTLLLSRNAKLALLSSALSIISPGGLFLSAPCGESLCSFFSFLGVFLFALRYQSKSLGGLYVVAAGASFGVATLVRSNALAYGLLFATEAVRTAWQFLQKPSASRFVHLGLTGLGGVLVACGSIVPQYMAWRVYCDTENGIMRPWCSNTLPSIYTFVQDYYWYDRKLTYRTRRMLIQTRDVGFLRYWTLNQLPLFILAAPVLTLLIQSGRQLCFNPRSIFPGMASDGGFAAFLVSLGFVQTAVAVLALTSYHVQIITRIGSAYPVWYWWIASRLVQDKNSSTARMSIMFMVMYGLIQAVLYASFLPPA